MESLLGEVSVKIVEMKTKNLEQKNLFDKAVVVFERLKSILKCTVDKMLSNTFPATEKSLVKGRVNQCGKL